MSNGFAFMVLVVSTVTTADSNAPPELKYQFLMQWRLGAPSFAGDLFSSTPTRDYVLYAGYMAPRGTLVLRPEKASGRRVLLRSTTVSILPLLTVQGAQFQKDGQTRSEFVPPEKLPKLKVKYEPDLPGELSAPGPRNCVLLFEIGEGKTGEWEEGHWQVTIGFDFSKLAVTPIDAGVGIIKREVEKGKGPLALYSFQFVAKKVRTEADNHNLLHYRYLNSRTDPNGSEATLESLGALIKVYPNEANFLHERACILASLSRFEGALKDFASIKALLREGRLRTRFSLDVDGDEMKPEAAIVLLELVERQWREKMAGKPESRATSASGRK